jgi:tetratricopeptide (TPR) repeat protein
VLYCGEKAMERSSVRWSRGLILLVILLGIIPLPSTCAKKKAAAGKQSRGGEGGGGGGGEEGISSGKVPEECNQEMSPKVKRRLASKHLDRASRVTGSDAIWHLTQAIECSSDKGKGKGKGGSGDVVGEASFRRAVAYETAGSRLEAMEDMKRACSSLSPSAAHGSDACMTLGVWSSEVGDTLTAYKAFSVAVSRNVQDERAWSNYGVVSNQMGKYEEALRSYKNAAALNPAKGQNFFK